MCQYNECYSVLRYLVVFYHFLHVGTTTCSYYAYGKSKKCNNPLNCLKNLQTDIIIQKK